MEFLHRGYVLLTQFPVENTKLTLGKIRFRARHRLVLAEVTKGLPVKEASSFGYKLNLVTAIERDRLGF